MIKCGDMKCMDINMQKEKHDTIHANYTQGMFEGVKITSQCSIKDHTK